jgi:hypothetical protein
MTDVLMDAEDGSFVVVDARVLKTTAADLILDSPARHKPGTRRLRRALVHDQQDGLTINFHRDYPGGVTINDVVELNNRLGSLTISGVKEISPYIKAVGAAPAGGGSLVLRGELMIEPLTRGGDGDIPPDPVSLQQLLVEMRAHVERLARRVDELEGRLRPPP